MSERIGAAVAVLGDDIRIAALVASGESKITNMGIIGRGYEHIIDKLKGLGAKILEVA